MATEEGQVLLAISGYFRIFQACVARNTRLDKDLQKVQQRQVE